MNTKYKKYLLSLVLALWASALSAQAQHWTPNTDGYSSHMTVYYTLMQGDTPASADNYEIAAFIGDECLGVGQTITAGGNTAQRILIAGDASMNGKKIKFKQFVKATQEEKDISGLDITYTNEGQQGEPSNPVVFDLSKTFIPGDADGDGVVDLTDAVAIFQWYMSGEYPNFNQDAADFDGDGTVDLTDAVLVFDYYMNQ